MFSRLMLVMGAAPILAPLIGAQILAAAGWRAIFGALAIAGALCLAMTAFALPETLPPARRRRIGPVQILVSFLRLLRDRRYMGFALSGGLLQAGMFAYIAGSPFVFIGHFGVPPERFGWYFGANAFGLIAASQLNHRLLGRVCGPRILRAATLGNTLACGILFAAAVSGAGGITAVVVPLFLAIASLGFVMPNAIAGAMAPHGAQAGIASALYGTLQFGAGALAGTLVGAVGGAGGGAAPMAAVMLAASLAGMIAHRLLRDREAAR